MLSQFSSAPSLQKAKRIFGYQKMPPPIHNKEHLLSKQHTLLHWGSVLGYGALLANALLGADNFSSLVALMIFMLVTSIPMLLRNWKFLLLLLGILACSAAFPPLAPLFVIVFLLFYLRRLLMVLTHWKPVLAGFLLYVSVIFSQVFTSLATEHLKGSKQIEEIFSIRFGAAVIVVPLGAMCFHLILRWLYANHYGTKTALAIMGVFPLLLLALIMPILKLDFGIEVPEVPTEVPAGGLIAESGAFGAQASAGSLIAEQASATASETSAVSLQSSLSGLEAASAHQASLSAQETVALTSVQHAKSAAFPNTTPLMDAHATEQAILSSKTAAASRSTILSEGELAHNSALAHTKASNVPPLPETHTTQETTQDLFQDIAEDMTDHALQRKPTTSSN